MEDVVVLAGGTGTRLRPYTTVLPKPLMPVGDMPVLEILLRRLAAAGLTRINLAVGHLAELIEAYFGDGSRFGVELVYWREDEPLGTAGPIARMELDGERVLVMNGDLLTTLDFAPLLDEHRSSGAAATIAVLGARGADRLRCRAAGGRHRGWIRGKAGVELQRQHGRLRV